MRLSLKNFFQKNNESNAHKESDEINHNVSFHSFAFALPKDDEYPNEYQDSSKISFANNAVAVADGVSNSYLSKHIADILTSLFINGYFTSAGELEPFIPRIQKLYTYLCNRSWRNVDPKFKKSFGENRWKEKAIRGGSSTFMGARLTLKPDGKEYLDYFGFGDTALILFKNNRIVQEFSWKDLKNTNIPPQLVVGSHDYKIPSDVMSGSICTEDFDVAIIATDGVAPGILQADNSILRKICDRNTPPDTVWFKKWVEQLRRDGIVEVDDASLVSMYLNK